MRITLFVAQFINKFRYKNCLERSLTPNLIWVLPRNNKYLTSTWHQNVIRFCISREEGRIRKNAGVNAHFGIGMLGLARLLLVVVRHHKDISEVEMQSVQHDRIPISHHN